MKRGYARVSTDDQRLDLQHDELRRAGCEVIYSEHVSGAAMDRPELQRLLEELQPGDSVVVWRLDRLGRSLSHLIQLVKDFGNREVDFVSLSESIDTSTPGGELIFHIFGAFAQFERATISERTRAGMAAAKARGSLLGRPKRLSRHQVAHARDLIEQGMAKREVCRLFKVSPATLYRAL
jgi:DNA invertase Pin-like site-specific DNA recombinase